MQSAPLPLFLLNRSWLGSLARWTLNFYQMSSWWLFLVQILGSGFLQAGALLTLRAGTSRGTKWLQTWSALVVLISCWQWTYRCRSFANKTASGYIWSSCVVVPVLSNKCQSELQVLNL